MGEARPLSVLQVTHYLPPHPGGIERVADVLFNGYRRVGMNVTWLGSRVPSDAPSYEDGRIRVPCLNFAETRFGLPVPIWGAAAVRELSRQVRGADVVHVHDCQYPGSALAIRLARRLGRPSILTQHVGFKDYRNGAVNALQRVVYATMGRAILRSATHIVLATPPAEAHVRALLDGLPPGASRIPNGMDLNRFRPVDDVARYSARQRLGLAEDRPVALFAGRLVDRKGLPLLLDAAKRLPETHFVIVGDGPLESLVRSGPPNVAQAGGVPYARMADYYHAANCLVLLSDGEGLPLVVQEALASGLSAVLSDHEPYVRPLAQAGLVHAVPLSEDAVVAAIRSASVVDAARSAAASRYAAEHWDVEVMISSYADIVRNIAASRSGP
jgi:D-inositol-3-phosphate glycosyltransferase